MLLKVVHLCIIVIVALKNQKIITMRDNYQSNGRWVVKLTLMYDIYGRHSRVIMVDVENYNVNGEYLWNLDLYLKT